MKIFDALAGIRIGAISLSTILSALVVVAVCFVVKNIVSGLFSKVMAKSKLDGSLQSFFKNAINVGLWALIILIAAETLGIPTASLVAALSVAGLALSLAVQGILGNLFSGIIMLGTRPFHDGDLVDIGSASGVVKSLGLFYTVIVTGDNRTINIPNSTVASAQITNYSANPRRRIDLTVTASYDAGTENVKAALMDACANTAGVLTDPAPAAFIADFGASSVVYTLQAWVESSDFLSVKAALTGSIRDSFAKHGVEMTFDHLNVHVIEK